MANLSYTKGQVDEAIGRSINSGLICLLHADEAFSGEFLGDDQEGTLLGHTINEAPAQFTNFIIESEVRAKHVNVEGAEIDYVFKILVNEVAVKTITPIISNENVGTFIGGVYIFPLKVVVENLDPGNPFDVKIRGYYSLPGGQVSAHSLRIYGVLG